MEVNGNVIQAVRCLVSVAQDPMATETEKLDAIKTLVEVPDLFSTEIGLLKSEVEKARESLRLIANDSMTTTRGKIRASNLCIKMETLILRAGK